VCQHRNGHIMLGARGLRWTGAARMTQSATNGKRWNACSFLREGVGSVDRLVLHRRLGLYIRSPDQQKGRGQVQGQTWGTAQ